ncbi:MAG TPA: hypothetical protein VHP12_04035 [Chitinophagaceae bacterium]|nr:hypothetical protein [Chitinophagaceae bacterium]
MKISATFISLILAAIIITSCNKTASSPSYALTGTLSNSSSFNLKDSSTVFIRDTMNGIAFIQIIGVISVQAHDTTVAALTFSNITKTGTYALATLQTTTDTTGIIAYAIGKHGYVSIPTTSPGSFTITALSKTNITGTYNAKMVDSANNILTMQGSFNGTFIR